MSISKYSASIVGGLAAGTLLGAAVAQPRYYALRLSMSFRHPVLDSGGTYLGRLSGRMPLRLLLQSGQEEDCAKPGEGTNKPRKAVGPPIIVTVEKLGEKWALQ
jgi:hypothetical protein